MKLNDFLGDIQPIRIGVVGASGIGKSTLCYKLCDYLKPMYPDMIVNDEVARKVLADNKINTNELMDSSDSVRRSVQTSIFTAQLVAEMDTIEQSVIFDRTMIDIIAYSKLYKVPDLLLMYMTNIMLGVVLHYDVLLYCPVPFEYQFVDDGVRTGRNLYQVDTLIRELLGELTPDCYDGITMVNLGIQRTEWLNKAIEAIKDTHDGISN